MRIAVAMMLVLAGCGLGLTDDPAGGSDQVPTSGAGPYGKPDVDFDTPADEPFVVTATSGGLYDPEVLRRDDGGFRLWFGHRDEAEDSWQIWRAEIPGVRELPDVPPSVSLAADQDWEQDRIGAPSIVDLGDDQLVMYYQGGDPTAPAIGRAESADGGISWDKDPANPILTGAAEPSAVLVDGLWSIYLTRPNRADIFLATSDDGSTFTLEPEPVLGPRTAAQGAFDRAALSDPYVIAERTAAGRVHYAMFYNGFDGDEDLSIGYAGSFDGVSWQRPVGVEPVLTAGSPTEHGPAAILEADRGYLFYDQLGFVRRGIAVALHP